MKVLSLWRGLIDAPESPYSPLASEILADLKGRFSGGSTLRELHAWLGNPKDQIRAALRELNGSGAIFFYSNRWSARHDGFASMEQIIAETEAKYRLKPGTFLGDRSRFRSVSHPRQEAMHAMWSAGHAYAAIGRFFGMDHTNIIHGCDAHEKRSGALKEAA